MSDGEACYLRPSTHDVMPEPNHGCIAAWYRKRARPQFRGSGSLAQWGPSGSRVSLRPPPEHLVINCTQKEARSGILPHTQTGEQRHAA